LQRLGKGIPLKRVVAQIRKELTQTFRDRLTVALALVLPMILMALLGTAISLTVSDLPVVVQDLDQSFLSRSYIDAFRASITFRIVPLPMGVKPDEALDRGLSRAAIVIPEHFERDLQRGLATDVQIMIDATDANTANIMRGNAAAVTQAFLTQVKPVASLPAINAKTRLWFNPGRESTKYIGPGVLAVGLALFPPLLAALAMSREGEQKTILQVYVSSISAYEFLLGKTIAYTIIAVMEWVLLMIMAFTMFNLRLAGDPTPLLVTSFIYLFCTTSFGTMVGSAIPNQAAAIQAVAMGAFLLSFLLSGFIFPVSNIPSSIRWIANIVPARYFIEVTRDAFVRGGGWSAIWYAPVALGLLGATFFFIAWRTMRHMQVDA
jgi:drug efflux transport system permease protein